MHINRPHLEHVAKEEMNHIFATVPKAREFHTGQWTDLDYYRRHLVETVLRRIATAAAALAAGVLTVGSASPASADVPASIPIQYVTDFFWGDSDTVPVTGTVSCPSGTRMVSSGAGNGSLSGLAPNADFTAATAIGTARSGYLRVTVGCAPAAQMSEVTSHTIVLPGGTGFRRGVVYCPAGMRAFGGGGWIAKPFGRFSRDSYQTASNSVSADGTGWTFRAYVGAAIDRVYITTQCAPLRGSYVSQTGFPLPFPAGSANGYGSCEPGYTALSGGAYLSKSDGSEHDGVINWSVPASGNRWYVSGISYPDGTGTKLVALAQCIR